MPAFGPIRRRDLIRYLRQLGFSGPYPGGKHEYMQRGNVTLHVPNPHRSDIAPPLLGKILRQAGIEREEWEKL